MASFSRSRKTNNANTAPQDGGRVRKRVSNACSRCRRQKIRCSGSFPCEQCTRRGAACDFGGGHRKVLVSQNYVARLEREIASLRQGAGSSPQPDPRLDEGEYDHAASPSSVAASPAPAHRSPAPPAGQRAAPVPSESEDPGEYDSGSAVVDAGQGNPLSSSADTPSFAFDTHGRPHFLGVSSNWSFGRRVLSMAHERVDGQPLAPASLLFEGLTYDLGWDGRRCHSSVDASVIPAADYATFLINAVKFRCSQLFHLFDEDSFMQDFSAYYDGSEGHSDVSVLWNTHFLLILALGKAFTVRGKTEVATPPGGDLFVQAMQMLPDVTFLYRDPLHSIEVLCCASLYLQCLDHRGAAYNVIGQAMRIAVEQGMHTDMSHRLKPSVVERRRQAWWTTYILDRKMSSLLGAPMTLSDDDITAVLPSFAGSAQKPSALRVHVRLSKATAVIVRTVYGPNNDGVDSFLSRMREALSTLAHANEEQNAKFPLNLDKKGGISRFSAYLHLFHHQCLVLATRPLLFSFWQKRIKSVGPLRVSAYKGARSLVRVCVSSAHQCVAILDALRTQGLLDSFLPFDREAAFSSAVVLLLANAIDPSLVHFKSPPLPMVYAILDEMISWGSLLANLHKCELELLDTDLQKLAAAAVLASTGTSRRDPDTMENTTDFSQTGDYMVQLTPDDDLYYSWNSEDGLSGEQLLGLADSFNLEQFGWLAEGDSQGQYMPMG